MSKQRIFVAGHRGMVGSAIVRQLEKRADIELVLRDRTQLDLLDSNAVLAFFRDNQIAQVYLAAAKVGGIVANNTYPAEFIYQNLMIEANIIHAAHLSGVQKLLFLGSSCIYPKLAKQPITESELLQGTLEPTNEPYAIAKIAGIKLCESYNRQYGRDYRSVMPTNLYGPHDNFHPSNSHVIPALIRRFHEAKLASAPEVVVWGSGTPMREFLYVDDMAAASVHVMELADEIYQANTQPMLSHINVGTGVDCTIREMAETIAARLKSGKRPFIAVGAGHFGGANGLLAMLAGKGAEIRGCAETCALVAGAVAATEEDYAAEFLAPIISVKVVGDLDEAIEHINRYGSHHTDTIVTENYSKALRFLREVDASAVMVNASTRFADGFEYGLGAEIGISTDRLHARGPVGLEGLTSLKYIVLGHGEGRS